MNLNAGVETAEAYVVIDGLIRASCFSAQEILRSFYKVHRLLLLPRSLYKLLYSFITTYKRIKKNCG